MSVELAIKSMKEARRSLIDAKNGVVERTIFPWREDETVEPTPDYDGLIYDIEQQIIAMENKIYRDPEQYQEQYMELSAEMRMNGVRGDPHLYLHTPFEEELFQERIQHQVEYGYYDSEGYWEDGLRGPDPYGPCGNCKTVYDHEESFVVSGWTCCETCVGDALSFMCWLGFIANTEMKANKWDSEWWFVEQEDESDD